MTLKLIRSFPCLFVCTSTGYHTQISVQFQQKVGRGARNRRLDFLSDPDMYVDLGFFLLLFTGRRMSSLSVFLLFVARCYFCVVICFTLQRRQQQQQPKPSFFVLVYSIVFISYFLIIVFSKALLHLVWIIIIIIIIMSSSFLTRPLPLSSPLALT